MVKKALIETVGSFMYIDGKQEIKHDRPTLAEVTPFVETLIASGNISLVIPNFPAEANDAEFEEVYIESDRNDKLAAATYASLYGIDETGQPAVAD